MFLFSLEKTVFFVYYIRYDIRVFFLLEMSSWFEANASYVL